MSIVKRSVLIAIPAMLLVACWTSRPFAQVVTSKTLSTSMLSRPQKTNLSVAGNRLNGWLIRPGEEFSFNQVVGPRTAARGYLAAPSYIGAESPPTIGGGICLLSSALYQLALSAGLSIRQRIPHLRTIQSVPPGLDATVWYGGADLRFTNTFDFPVRIKIRQGAQSISLALEGARAMPEVAVNRITERQTTQEILVTVFQKERMVSRDLYRLSP
jgi:vancomycin resistance protein VanW